MEPHTQYLLLLKGEGYTYQEIDYLSIPNITVKGPSTSICIDQVRRNETQSSILARFWLSPFTFYWVAWTTKCSPDGQFEFYSAPQEMHVPLVRMAWKCIDTYPEIFSFPIKNK